MEAIRKLSVGDIFPRTLFTKKTAPPPSLLRVNSDFSNSDETPPDETPPDFPRSKSLSVICAKSEQHSNRKHRSHHHHHHHHRHRHRHFDIDNEISLALEKAVNHENNTISLSLEATEENKKTVKMDQNIVRHKGGCHCGAVRFEALGSATPNVIECNCSICVKKQNRHFIIPQSNFKLLKGHDSLTTYTFNSHKAKHSFCSICGVQSFYIPRSNANGYGIIVHCLDEGTIRKEKVEKFDGKNWEQEIKKKSHIAGYSNDK